MSKKGVTPVVATTMLIAITVAGVGTAYMFLTDSVDSADSDVSLSTENIELQSCWRDNKAVALAAVNRDKKTINASKVQLYINKEQIKDFNVSKHLVKPEKRFIIETNGTNITRGAEIRLIYGSESFYDFCEGISSEPWKNFLLERGGGHISEIRTGKSVMPIQNHLCIGNTCAEESTQPTSYDTRNERIDTRGDEVNGSLTLETLSASNTACIGDLCPENAGSKFEPLTPKNNEMKGSLKLKSVVADPQLCIGDNC